MQPESIASFGWGRSAHFDGALALMQILGLTFTQPPGFISCSRRFGRWGYVELTIFS